MDRRRTDKNAAALSSPSPGFAHKTRCGMCGACGAGNCGWHVSLAGTLGERARHLDLPDLHEVNWEPDPRQSENG